MQTIDPKFDELEQKVLSMESLLRQLLKDLGNWQDELQVSILILGMLPVYFSNLLCKLQHVVEGRETLTEGMDLYCSSGVHVESLTNYHQLLHSLQKAFKTNVSN